MSLLTQLRYRIKAIDTIKKITHAMRLISMSSRSKLKNREEPLQEYIKTAQQLLQQVQNNLPEKTQETENKPYNPLVILIGSQRGLCGNFNTVLFNFFEKITQPSQHPDGIIQIIPVGKKAVHYVEDNAQFRIIEQFSELSAKTLHSIAHAILMRILDPQSPFTHVVVFSNKLKTFFIQKPHETILLPFHDQEPSARQPLQAYYWEQSPQDVINQLKHQIIEANVEYLLFQSLLAEHAARFITMDNATRNAQSLLEDTQLQYNKLRQAKITKELTELVSNM